MVILDRMGLRPNDWHPYKQGTTWRDREGGHVTIEAEVLVIGLQLTDTKDPQQRSSWERPETDFPSEPS